MPCVFPLPQRLRHCLCLTASAAETLPLPCGPDGSIIFNGRSREGKVLADRHASPPAALVLRRGTAAVAFKTSAGLASGECIWCSCRQSAPAHLQGENTLQLQSLLSISALPPHPPLSRVLPSRSCILPFVGPHAAARGLAPPCVHTNIHKRQVHLQSPD